MSAFAVKIEGYDRLMQVLKNLPKEKLEAVEDVFFNAATNITLQQKQLAPKDEGGIAQSISFRQVSSLEFEMVAQKGYAPYVEFGTKSKAVIPPELAEIAAEFRGGQKMGVNAKEAIYKWADRHGIPEERWYLVYRSIMTNGIRPHPFFFSPFFSARAKIIADVKAVLMK